MDLVINAPQKHQDFRSNGKPNNFHGWGSARILWLSCSSMFMFCTKTTWEFNHGQASLLTVTCTCVDCTFLDPPLPWYDPPNTAHPQILYTYYTSCSTLPQSKHHHRGGGGVTSFAYIRKYYYIRICKYNIPTIVNSYILTSSIYLTSRWM